jgi:hypothetical protein
LKTSNRIYSGNRPSRIIFKELYPAMNNKGETFRTHVSSKKSLEIPAFLTERASINQNSDLNWKA